MATTKVANKPVGPIGFGLMGMTWSLTNPKLPSQSQCFEAMDAALSKGANFFNGGELYADGDRNSCDLLKEYFEAHPEHADKVVLSIKGGTKPGSMMPDGSEANARRSVENCINKLGGTKKIDIFEYARVDPNTPVEETLGYLKKLVDEGKIGAVGLSEVRASTIERASKIVPIAAVEVELSLWSPDILRNGVAETCARLGIPIVAYSPLMRGALADNVSDLSSLPEHDFRRHLPKFQDDALQQNLKLNKEVEALAQRKGVKAGQIAINWVRALSGRKVKVYDADGKEKEITLGTVIPIPGSTKPDRVVDNSTYVELSEEEMGELQDILDRNPITGLRYPPQAAAFAEG